MSKTLKTTQYSPEDTSGSDCGSAHGNGGPDGPCTKLEGIVSLPETHHSQEGTLTILIGLEAPQATTTPCTGILNRTELRGWAGGHGQQNRSKTGGAEARRRARIAASAARSVARARAARRRHKPYTAQEPWQLNPLSFEGW